MAWWVEIPATVKVFIPDAEDEGSAKFQAEELTQDEICHHLGRPCEGRTIKLRYSMAKAKVRYE